MDAEPLAYTPHPTARPRVSVLAVAGAAPEVSTGTPRGFAMFAAAALALGSTMLALTGAPRTAAGGVLSANAGRMFASSERRAVVTPAAEPAPVELRQSSPLPFAGSDLTANAAAVSSDGSGSSGPSSGGSLGQAIAGGQPGPQQFHALTSFDGNMTMTSGQVEIVQPARSGRQERLGYVPPAPVVWNNPVKWIQVHKEGL
ncbi:MAG: hypothetical protein HY923_00070 [Elusimicrobia bacterium]|nr:hypothetical protein [Elusimicrobiota bacterium]